MSMIFGDSSTFSFSCSMLISFSSVFLLFSVFISFSFCSFFSLSCSPSFSSFISFLSFVSSSFLSSSFSSSFSSGFKLLKYFRYFSNFFLFPRVKPNFIISSFFNSNRFFPSKSISSLIPIIFSRNSLTSSLVEFFVIFISISFSGKSLLFSEIYFLSFLIGPNFNPNALKSVSFKDNNISPDISCFFIFSWTSAENLYLSPKKDDSSSGRDELVAFGFD